MDTADTLLALISAPPAAAEPIAVALVERKLAACVNVVPTVGSVYRWQGRVERDQEALLVVKTTRPALAAIELLLEEIHPYETFELIALEIAAGSAAYLDWLRDAVGERP